MTLLGLQQEFAWNAGRLILRAAEMGYATKLGDARRSIEEQRRLMAAGLSGILNPAKGAHVRQLAIDLLLFHSGHYLRDTADYQPLGEWWEQQHHLARWGGHFRDGNHFSFEHEGIR